MSAAILQRDHANQSLQDSERRYSQIIEYSPIAMAVSDKKGCIEQLNREFVEIFGYDLTDIPTVEH